MIAESNDNLVSWLEGLVPPEGECQTVEMRRRENAPADARLFFKGRNWLASPEGAAFLSGLAAHPLVVEARAKGPAISIRLDDDFLERLGRRIEQADLDSNDIPGLDTSALLAGRSFMVGFAGPNTSKALHIGHLRNVSIGNALAAVLRASGANVVRQSLVGDIGRNICEAMAGYRLFHDGEDPNLGGRKADHFIGECYSRFIREHADRQSVTGGDPIERELSNTNDTADRFMQGWLAGEADAREFWARIRTWVLDAHEETLRRFGVTIDRHDFESDAMADVPQILADGIARGVLEREPDGTIVYRSGREEFETMIMTRNDDFPTEHARLIGVYFRLLDERTGGASYLDLAGTEWQPASAIHMELMARIYPDRPNIGHEQLFHGMVTMKNSKMSSSDGDAVLIDELLDRLGAVDELRAVAEMSGGRVAADALAGIVVKSFFLCRPHMKVMEYSWDLLIGPENPGWTIARAWCSAMAPESGAADEADIPFDADRYRLLVIRSQEFHRNLSAAALEFDLAGLSSYLVHYCEDYLAAPEHPRMKRLARVVLHRCLKGLGLIAAD